MINKKNILYSFTRIPKINYSTSIGNEDLKQFSEIPGPKVYPFVGNLFELKSFGLFYCTVRSKSILRHFWLKTLS